MQNEAYSLEMRRRVAGARKAQNLLVTGSNDDEAAAFFSERSVVEAVKVKRESDYEIEALDGANCLFDFAS